MNRRAALFAGFGLALVVGVGAVIVSNAVNQSDQKVTLRSRILAFDKVRKSTEKEMRKEKIDEIVTQLMAEYFQIGMSEDECVRILLANDLKVDERYINVLDDRKLPQRIYFNSSIVSIVQLPIRHLLVSFRYRLILQFFDGKLDRIGASFNGTGP